MISPIILAVPYMAWTSRMCGGGKPALPLGLSQWFYALPYLALLGPLTGWYAVLAYLGAVAGKRSPTAPWLDLGHSDKWRSNSLTFLIDWMRGRVSETVYDAAGLAISGLASVIAPALLLAIWGHPCAAGVLIVSGLMKVPAYFIGWAIFPSRNRVSSRMPEDLNEATELAELLAGLFAGVGVVIASGML